MDDLARCIDHTQLKPDADASAYGRLVDEAVAHGFFSVCVPPAWVSACLERIGGRGPVVATVVGFPNGYSTGASKAFEAREVIGLGAVEVDMVINVGELKSGRTGAVLDEIRGVVEAVGEASGGSGLVKVILETALLGDDEKRVACELSVEAGAAFVKTSTGFGPGGATEADVRLMREVVGSGVGVKASGGIRDRRTALAMIEAGASRLGCSASVAIVSGSIGEGGY